MKPPDKGCLVLFSIKKLDSKRPIEVYLLLFGRSNNAKISENWGRFEGVLFQHFVIRDFRVCGQSLGISGLRPQAAMPTAACTGEYAE